MEARGSLGVVMDGVVSVGSGTWRRSERERSSVGVHLR
jgi:hypothetical protein